MIYKIKSKIHLQNEIQNIVKNQLTTALTEIEQKNLSLTKKVHRIRMMCKKARGLLQVVKPILKEPAYYQEQNSFYKELAKLLASSREAKVMLDMFELVIKDYNLQRKQFSDIEKVLKKQNHDENLDENEMEQKLQTCAQLIEKALNEYSAWQLSCDDIYGLKKGFNKTYKKARKYMKRAYAESDIEDFHIFRKFAKYHMYHVSLLSQSSILPKTREKELKKLTDILGWEHDLTLFESHLKQNLKTLESVKKLIPYLHLEQKRLRKIAHKLERRLFELTPERLTGYAIL